MGKPSLKSRKSSRIRKKNRKFRMIKELKKKEVSDLQIQMQDFKKTVFNTGENILNNVEQCSRKNNNLVEWLKLYDKQIKDYEKEIYNLYLRLYFLPQSSQQPPYQQPHQPQQHQPQSPTFSSLADYFKSHKGQE